jgi:RNA polymerase sigma-70 factor (ECF subfamily)
VKVSDNDIVKIMRGNAEQGFRLLMKSYKEPVYWHIRRMVVTHADAQDAAQETFVRIFRNFSQYSDGKSFKAWIYRIATNEALRLLGKRNGRATLSLDDVTADIVGKKADGYYDDSDEMVARLQQAILHLPAKQQLAFNLRYYDEMSYEDIAEVAGSTAASMKVSYGIAKEKITQFIMHNS